MPMKSKRRTRRQRAHRISISRLYAQPLKSSVEPVTPYTGYGVKTMPGIREGVEKKAWDDVARYLSIVTNSIENLAGRVDQARELLVKLVG